MLILLKIENSLATAANILYGGHIVSWQPKTQPQPLLLVSKLVKYQKGKAFRGGVRISWPWFDIYPRQHQSWDMVRPASPSPDRLAE